MSLLDLDAITHLVDVVPVPPGGVWRVGHQPDPLRSSRLDLTLSAGPAARAGNRWDSPRFGVRYFASEPEGCFGETLVRLRPVPSLADMVRDEWTGDKMAPGQLPRDWRDKRAAVRASLQPTSLFLDVETLRTRTYLQEVLALGLSSLGVRHLDVDHVRGADRRVTQLVSEWAWGLDVEQPSGQDASAFAGIVSTSRVNSDWRCWAVYDRVDLGNTDAHPILATTPALAAVCDTFSIRVH